MQIALLNESADVDVTIKRFTPLCMLSRILCIAIALISVRALGNNNPTDDPDAMLAAFVKNSNRAVELLARASFDVNVRGFVKCKVVPEEKQLTTTQISFGRQGEKWKIERKANILSYHAGKFVEVQQDYTYLIDESIYRVDRPSSGDTGTNPNEGIRAFVSHDMKDMIGKGLGNLGYGAFIYGVLFGNGEKQLADVLKTLDVSTDGKTYSVDGHDTKLLTATGRNGTFKLWLDPSAGYVLRRLEVSKANDDLLDGRPINTISNMAGPGTIYPTGQLLSCERSIDQVITEAIDGVHLVREYVQTTTYHFKDDETLLMRDEVKISNLNINPTFPNGFFSISSEIPNGSHVQDLDNPQIMYEWRDGKLGLRLDKAHLKELAESQFVTDGNWLTWRSAFLVVNAVIVLLLLLVFVRRKYSQSSQ